MLGVGIERRLLTGCAADILGEETPEGGNAGDEFGEGEYGLD